MFNSIRKRLNGATPGPWKLEVRTHKQPSGRDWEFYEVWHSPDGSFKGDETYSLHDRFGSCKPTSEFIANSRADVETLLKAVDVLTNGLNAHSKRLLDPIYVCCSNHVVRGHHSDCELGVALKLVEEMDK